MCPGKNHALLCWWSINQSLGSLCHKAEIGVMWLGARWEPGSCVHNLQTGQFYTIGQWVIKLSNQEEIKPWICVSAGKRIIWIQRFSPGKNTTVVVWNTCSFVTTLSSPPSVLAQTIFPRYNPIRMSSWSFRGTNIPLTVKTRPPIQQRSLLAIYGFHTTPPRSTITFSIKLLILSDGVWLGDSTT